MLYLHKIIISWTSPLLRNLSRLVLIPGFAICLFEPTSVEMFLTALANCPVLVIEAKRLVGSRGSLCSIFHHAFDVVVYILCHHRDTMELR